MPRRVVQPGLDALAAERQFVKTLGGFVLGIAGAELVTHERIPLPRFNFVVVGDVSLERGTAFFERVLDHYFQRALRPTFRVLPPVPAHLARGLARFGFRARPEPLVLLVGARDHPTTPGASKVRVASRDELDEAVALWNGPEGGIEFRAAVETAWRHPNPGERLTPIVGVRGSEIVSAGLRYEHSGTAGLHFVTTVPNERGQGAASGLVGAAFEPDALEPNATRFLFADSARLERRLRSLGFDPVLTYQEFELPPEAELDLPGPGPATPPRWRPPREIRPG